MEEEKMKIINFISKKYTYNILKSLDNEAKRFKDLKAACKGEKMRTQRLKELEKSGFISVTIRRIGRRPVSFYKLSERGKLALNVIDGLKPLIKEIRTLQK